MNNLSRQEIDAERPFDFHLAADARMSQTDYCDDQAWRLQLGRGTEPALCWQTQYGGRADSVRLTALLRLDEQLIYHGRAYAQPPVIRAFAPNFLQLDAMPSAELALTARYWVMDSRAAGGEYILQNTGDSHLQLTLELIAAVDIRQRKRKLHVLTQADYSLALHLGQVGKLNPVLVLEDATVEVYGGRIDSPKLGCRLVLAPGERRSVRFVVAGYEEMRDSLSVAQHWLAQSWSAYYARIDELAAASPKIRTGNREWDLLLDLSYAQLLKSFMRPTAHLPMPSLVAARASQRGWSRRGDGSDHPRDWAGQAPAWAYLAGGALASVDAGLARGLLQNYLAVQEKSGFIDQQPGLGGQLQGLACRPILARLCWQIYQQGHDEDMVKAALPGLRAFFEYWLAQPRAWQSERQMGYIAFPTFARGLAWGQGADVRSMESPDLLAYLISEAAALGELAQVSGDAGCAQLAADSLAALDAQLEQLWDGQRYRYRDRETGSSAPGVLLLQRGAGDEVHEIARELPQPARVLLRIVGGLRQRPRISVQLEGRDAAGKPYSESAPADAINWQNRQGIYTSQRAFSFVQRISVPGLSRVYKLNAASIDSSRLDINALLPLWTGRLPRERAAALVELALDEQHFRRAKGITMVSARDQRYDPSNARGAGGIWMYWQALLLEGMLAAGYRREACDLLQCLLEVLARVLQRDGKLAQFYHAEEARGIGQDHHIAGLAPLNALHELLGLRIVAPDCVQAGGDFLWGQPVTIEQHGVYASRSADGTRIDFPSGQRVELPPDSPWQTVWDSRAAAMPEGAAAAPSLSPPLPISDEDTGPIEIALQPEDGQPLDDRGDDAPQPDATDD